MHMLGVAARGVHRRFWQWLVGAVCCSLSAASWADTQGSRVFTEVGTRLSLGGTSLRASSDDVGVGVETSPDFGYSLGAYATIWGLDWIRLHAELLYSSKKSTLTQAAAGMTAGYTFSYLELPLLVRFDIPIHETYRPSIALGVAPEVLLTAEHSAGHDLDGVLRSWDASVVAAVGVNRRLGSRWLMTIEARYAHGITAVFARTAREHRGLLLTIALGYRIAPHPERSADSPLLEGVDDGARSELARSPENPVPHDDVADVEALQVMAGVSACYRAYPGVVARMRTLPAEREVMQLVYFRTEDGSEITLSEPRVVDAPGHASGLVNCVVRAVEGMSWERGLSREQDEGWHRLSFRAGELGDFLGELGY